MIGYPVPDPASRVRTRVTSVAIARQKECEVRASNGRVALVHREIDRSAALILILEEPGQWAPPNSALRSTRPDAACG